MGSIGFIDLLYQLLPMVKNTVGVYPENDEEFLRMSQQAKRYYVQN